MSVRVAIAWSFLLAGLMAGCGPAAPPPEELVPVSGIVRLGGSPAEGVRVLFLPDGDTPGTGAVGTSDASGNYTLLHRTQKEGIPPGKYYVVFSRFLTADGKPIPPNTSPYMSGGKESIPPLWSDPTKKNTHNTVQIPEGGKLGLDWDVPAR